MSVITVPDAPLCFGCPEAITRSKITGAADGRTAGHGFEPFNKVGPNAQCPCLSGKKYKHCCRGKIDWEQILRSGRFGRDLVSVRGRNLLFVEAIHDALQLDTETNSVSLARYKRAFTAEAVRKIYEAVCDLWPPHTDIQSLLERAGADVSGLYIGDYAPDYVTTALVRHSVYANKILLIEPFQHPYILSPEYNPFGKPRTVPRANAAGREFLFESYAVDRAWDCRVYQDTG